MENQQISKQALLNAAQTLLRQDDREFAAQSRQSHPYSPARLYFLLKTRLRRSKLTEPPAKSSMFLEGTVLMASALIGAVILLLLISHFRHG
jgi:hypothetical protein